MRSILITLFAVIPFIMGKAQASYGDLFLVDYNIKINVSTENDSIYLSLIMTSASQQMTDDPKLLLRLMDDTVISLDGRLISSTSKSDGAFMIGNIAVASNHFITEAKFPIAREQVESLSKGVKKLRLNTSPKYHEKEWRKDKIGKKLYEKYKESSANSFEDGF